MRITIGRADNKSLSPENETPLEQRSDNNHRVAEDHIELGGVRVHGVKLESIESARATLSRRVRLP